jgi:hypothetical protein
VLTAYTPYLPRSPLRPTARVRSDVSIAPLIVGYSVRLPPSSIASTTRPCTQTDFDPGRARVTGRPSFMPVFF